jgi:hypothetical protein
MAKATNFGVKKVNLGSKKNGKAHKSVGPKVKNENKYRGQGR